MTSKRCLNNLFISIACPFLLAILHNSCDSAKEVNEEQRIAFKFSDEAPYLVIPVTLQDSIPANLLFDSGWCTPVLDSAFVSRYPSLTPKDNLLSENVTMGSAWNLASARRGIAYSDPEFKTLKFKVGDNVLNYDFWEVGDFRTLMGVNNVDGMMCFPSADSTKVYGFNFEHNYLTIQEADSFEMPKECQVFPMKKTPTAHPAGMSFSVNLPLKIQTSDGDTITMHRDFFVDSGAWNDIIITKESPELTFFNTKKDAVWIATPDARYTRNHAVKVGIGDYGADSFRVTTYDHKTGVHYPYLIGTNFLKHFNVYFDFQRQVMGLEPIPNFERIIDKHARRFHMGFCIEAMMRQGRYIIETIADNKENTYYAAGLRVGDEIIAANGMPMKDLAPEQREAMYKGDSIRFKVMRDNKDMEITVPINRQEPIGY